MRQAGCRKHADSPVGQGQSERAAGEAEQRALQQQLAGDAPPSGAQRGANRELLLTSIGADEEQIRDVGAGDQQDHTYSAHQNPQCGANIAHQIVLEQP